MEVDELPAVDPNVDYRQINPIHQKRTIAFINHFIMNTVSFLNEFAQNCESRLLEFDYKIQKVEASLLILESQLSSISGLDISPNKPKLEQVQHIPEPISETSVVETGNEDVSVQSAEIKTNESKACKDPRFSKFFKMVQFGVPSQAVKLKMQTEGLDPNILDKPNEVIPGSELIKKNSDNSDSNSDSS